MEGRLIVVGVFVCIICHVAEAQQKPGTVCNLNFTSTTCGSSKLCVSSPDNCNPAGKDSCSFCSIQQLNSQTFSIELSGMTSGYVALGLSNQTQGDTDLFICGNNNSTIFFQTAKQNSTGLTLVNLTNVQSVQVCAVNTTNSSALIQCTFNMSNNYNTNLFRVQILNGSVTQGQPGFTTTVYDSKKQLDLTNPRSSGSDSIFSCWTHVLAVLLSVVTLHLL